MKGFKGFDKDMKCRGFQYAENKEFKEDVKPSLCERGLHFCENPLDVFGYYPPCDDNQFYEVEALGDTKKGSDKSVTNHLRIGAKIGIVGLVKSHVEIVIVDWRVKDEEYYIHEIYSAKIGKKIKGTIIKPDTWYWFENGILKSEQ